ncbi:uncharacterized protein TNCV_4036471 [Trichonephila clavipes]|nr:uncharacterized protein TNCV_4036471 [Trichonephila clavipes]
MQKIQKETKERMENMQRSQEEIKEIMENMQRSQEETKERMVNRQRSKEETTNELKEGKQEGLEDMQIDQERIQKSNRWTEEVKACQLVASLRAEAAEVFQTLTDTKLLNLNSLYIALDLRFGEKFSIYYARLQMKIRHQKPEESLQEYASEMQMLTNLAFSDFSANVREMISLKYFVDALKEGEIQMAVRMADVQDLKSALLYALKLEAATQASHRDRQSIRGARVTLDDPCEPP